MTAQVHGDHASCDQGHAHELPLGRYLAVDEQADHDNRHNPDTTPEGIGEALGSTCTTREINVIEME